MNQYVDLKPNQLLVLFKNLDSVVQTDSWPLVCNALAADGNRRPTTGIAVVTWDSIADEPRDCGNGNRHRLML